MGDENQVRPVYAGPAAEAPSEAIPAAPAPAPMAAAAPAASDGLLTDSKGRKLKLRELTILNEMDLMEIAGDQKAMNRPWMMNVMLAARVAEIDGVPVPLPNNLTGLRGMMARVDREGIAAVIGYLNPDDDAVALAPGAADEALAKN